MNYTTYPPPSVLSHVMNDTTYSPTSTPTYAESYNLNLDRLYGIVYCFCFGLGFFGNILSFSYFLTRRSDLPNTLYRIITIVDVVTGVGSLAMAVTFLTERTPGLIFGTPVLCTAWSYLWHVTSRLSIFLVVVLSCSRTYYLLRPFGKQRLGPSLGVIAVYALLQIAQTVWFQVQEGTNVRYVQPMARCVLLFGHHDNEGTMLYLDIVRTITFILPIFVVFVSCAISTRVTLRRISRSIRYGSGRGELRKSRNRATVTIMLFAGVWALLNVPLVVSEILHTIDYHCDYRFDFHSFDYNGVYLLYYDNFVSVLSVSVNAALNPLLYLWRMPSCRVFMETRKPQLTSQGSNFSIGTYSPGRNGAAIRLKTLPRRNTNDSLAPSSPTLFRMNVSRPCSPRSQKFTEFDALPEDQLTNSRIGTC